MACSRTGSTVQELYKVVFSEQDTTEGPTLPIMGVLSLHGRELILHLYLEGSRTEGRPQVIET